MLALAATGAVAQEAQPQPQPTPAQDQTKREPQRKSTPTMPRGMVRYDHPIVRNGKTILWHGAWRDRLKAKDHGDAANDQTSPAQDQAQAPKDQAQAPKDQAPAPKEVSRAIPAPAARPAGFTLLADPSDACSTRLAGDFVAALKSDGLDGKVVGGGVSAGALAAAVAGDRADLAIAPMDALIGDSQATANWRERAPFIAKLDGEPIEIIAARDVTDLRQLAGRDVSFGPTDSADATSATALFRAFGVAPHPAYKKLDDALSDLAAGRLAAVVTVDGRCAPTLAQFGADRRFHELAVPWTPALKAVYAPARLSAKDRPNLIDADQKVDTVAASRALLAVDAAPGTPRADNAGVLAKAFLGGFDRLIAPDRDAVWRDVNLAAEAPWPRLRAAQDWIDAARPASDASLEAFRGLAHSAAATDGGPAAQDSDRLYDSLMQWRGAGK